MRLFDRRVAVTLDTLRITDLRVALRIDRTLAPEPNTLDLLVWNLSGDSRKRLQSSAPLRVIVEAGYAEGTEQIFVGDVRNVTSVHEDADWITRIWSGDGEVAYRTAQIDEALAAGARVEQVFRRAAEALGLSLGNALEKARAGDVRGALAEWTKGTVLSGRASDELTKLCRTLGYTWSIQDGAIQVLADGDTTGEQALVLSPSSGLIGSPEAGEKGIVHATSLLQPGLRPGRGCKLESELFNGFYRVERAMHAADTHGQQWTTDLNLRPI